MNSEKIFMESYIDHILQLMNCQISCIKINEESLRYSIEGCCLYSIEFILPFRVQQIIK